MTQKERKLGLVAGGMFAAFLLYMVVGQMLISPITGLRGDIKRMQDERDRLNTQAQAETTYRRLWTELASRTLGSEKTLATGRLDELIKNLLSESGLRSFTVNPGDIKPSKDKLHAVIPYTIVGAEGDMAAFAKFLHSFYQQPYAMQITGFNLEPVSYRKSGTLRISSLTVEALILPTEGLPASLVAASKPPATAPSTQPASGEVALVSTSRPPVGAIAGRLKDADLQSYAILWEKKFMEPYTEPKPERPKPQPAQAPVAMPAISPGGGHFTGPMEVRITCGTSGATIRYTTDGTNPSADHGQAYAGPVRLDEPGTIKAIAIGADDRVSGVATATFSVPPPPPMRLVMLGSYGDIREAVLVNEQTRQRQVVQEGESLDGGTLVAVLPQAAVVRMPDGPMYVYRLGQGFREKEVLDEQRQPDVWIEVQDLVDPAP